MKATYLFLGIALVVAMSSCSNKQKKAEQTTETTEEVVVVDETPAHIGTFEGTLPCADCPGIKTVLIINADSTYSFTSEYLEKEDGLFEQSGVYSLVNNGEVLELVTPSTGEKIYFRIVADGVAVSDAEGTVNEGERAQDYVLTKK